MVLGEFPKELGDGWLEGLAFEMGVTFAGADTEATKPHRKYAHYKDQVGLKGLSSAKKWLKKGYGMAILLDPTKRLWVLDADSPADTQRVLRILQAAGITPLMVRTHRGMHFYFLLPESFPLERLKCHWCHKAIDENGSPLELDFKFGPHSWVFAPGTVKKGKAPYTPMSAWRTPPVVDPAIFCSNPSFYHGIKPTKAVTRLKPGSSVAPGPEPAPEEKVPFLVNQRPFKDRQIRGRAYLHFKAPIAISGKRGKRTLAGVLSHLLVYLGLDPKCVFEMLTYGEECWNNRCRHLDGTPYPWSHKEIWDAIEVAKDSTPTQGVKDWLAEQQKMKLDAMAGGLKAAICPTDARLVPIARVREAFEWWGFEGSSTALGRALSSRGVSRVKSSWRRTMWIEGLDYDKMLSNFLEAARNREIERRGYSYCPVLRVVFRAERAS